MEKLLWANTLPAAALELLLPVICSSRITLIKPFFFSCSITPGYVHHRLEADKQPKVAAVVGYTCPPPRQQHPAQRDHSGSHTRQNAAPATHNRNTTLASYPPARTCVAPVIRHHHSSYTV